MWRRFRKQCEPGIHKIEAARSRQRRDRENFSELEFFVVALDQRQKKLFAKAVHFVEQQKNGSAKTLHPLNREAVTSAEIGSGVHDESKNVDSLQGVLQFVHHHAAENIFRLMNPGRIDENDLRVVA